MKQTFAQLNEAEQEWIASSLERARTLLLECPLGDAEEVWNPELLDRAYKHWLNTETDIDGQANEVIHAIGFAFGQYLVDHQGFEWVLVTDSYGTDVGVLALPGRGDLLVCPVSLVEKRWETKETDFLAPIYQAVIKQRNKVRDLWDSHDKSNQR